jgi:predicted transcriptional regulator
VRPSLLEHQRRHAIYRVVEQAPGIHLREVQRRTGLRWGALQYHAGKLVGAGLLRTARAGRITVLACDVHRLAPEEILVLHLLRKPLPRAAAEALAARRVATPGEIALAAGLHPRVAADSLRRLAALGLARPAGLRPARYAPTPRLAEALARLAGPT